MRRKDEPKKSSSPSYSWIQSSSHEDAHIEIDARCRNDTAYGSCWQTAYILLCRGVVGSTVSQAILSRNSLSVDVWRPAHGTDEVVVCIVDCPDTFAVLAEVPTTKRFVIADAEYVLTARVESHSSYPIVMSDEGFNQNTTTVPNSNSLVTTASDNILGRAAVWRGLLHTSKSGQRFVSCRRSEGTAFDDVLVPHQDNLDLTRVGIPKPCGLIIAS